MGKLKIKSLKKDSEPYLVCEAEVIKEDTNIGDFRKAQLRKLHQMLNRWIERNILDPAQSEIFARSISQPLEIIGASASYLIRDHDIQQEVLEKNSLEEKIELIYRLASSSELAQ
jgi:ATP-dependent Lon protease